MDSSRASLKKRNSNSRTRFVFFYLKNKLLFFEDVICVLIITTAFLGIQDKSIKWFKTIKEYNTYKIYLVNIIVLKRGFV